MVRQSIIIMITVSTFVLGVFFFIYTPENSSEIRTMSSFGEIILFDPKQLISSADNTFYQNDELNFQLTKPDTSWTIHSAYDDFSAEQLVSLESKGYLGGIYLEKEHDKRFLITVFDIKNENFQLKEYIDKQILSINPKSNVKIITNQVSESNDWAIFSVDMGIDDQNRYAEQLLFLKDKKLHMLQYSGNSPENLTDLEKIDFNLIMNSFEVI